MYGMSKQYYVYKYSKSKISCYLIRFALILTFEYNYSEGKKRDRIPGCKWNS